MREMLAVTAAINGAGLGEQRRAADRRALLRRHPRLHGRPRRARGGPRRPDRRGPRRRRDHDRRRRPPASTSTCPTRRSRPASPPTSRRRTRTAPACSRSTRRSSAAPRRAPSRSSRLSAAADAHRDRHRLDAAPLLGPVLGAGASGASASTCRTSAAGTWGITRSSPSRSSRSSRETHGARADRRRRALRGRRRGRQPLARGGPLHPHHEPPLDRRPRRRPPTGSRRSACAYDELYCSMDKIARCRQIGIDLLIDDSPVNLTGAHEAGIVGGDDRAIPGTSELVATRRRDRRARLARARAAARAGALPAADARATALATFARAPGGRLILDGPRQTARESRLRRPLTVILSSPACCWSSPRPAWGYERSRSETIAQGVMIGGVAVGGLDRRRRRARLERRLLDPLRSRSSSSAGSAHWHALRARGRISADIDGRVEAAIAAAATASSSAALSAT